MTVAADAIRDRVLPAVQRHWGYESLRPLQAEAMQAVLDGHDSVVVLPTGGGKSLCFQVPAVVLGGLAVVVSPLISLMKDQVDALRECGVPAAAVNSSLDPAERRRIADELRAGRLRLLYVAPERLCTEAMLEFLARLEVSFIAVDEAHCISAWGHDFRPEYRLLGQLRQRFPKAGVHAYTATATERVRTDIAEQLGLREPRYLVGSFDRPNLVYRVQRRRSLRDQLDEVLERHPGESGIVYCLSRREVDSLAEELAASGRRAVPYHAGLSDVARHRNQEAFVGDETDIVVATVAFGMGIDKPDVRFVIHATAPKSLEHYQQETGRAGRDGLESECCLFWSGGDFVTWRKMQSDDDGEVPEHVARNLRDMERYCESTACRHRQLVEYFGQTYDREGCGACDACLAEVALLPDALITAQKILSCVVRVGENFGAAHVADVLVGSRLQKVLERNHDKLSTWGLLKSADKTDVRSWIDQLLGQGLLEKRGEYGVLGVTPTGREVLRGTRTPVLRAPAATPARSKSSREGRRSAAAANPAGDAFFERLRALRRRLAEDKGVPSYVVFGDATLRDLVARVPRTLAEFRACHGVGDTKCAEFGAVFLEEIARHVGESEESGTGSARSSPASSAATRSKPRLRAAEMFRDGRPLAQVASELDRAESTVLSYLVEFLALEGRTDPAPWVAAETLARVEAATVGLDLTLVKPVFEALGGTVPYPDIHISLACLRNLRQERGEAATETATPTEPRAE